MLYEKWSKEWLPARYTKKGYLVFDTLNTKICGSSMLELSVGKDMTKKDTIREVLVG